MPLRCALSEMKALCKHEHGYILEELESFLLIFPGGKVPLQPTGTAWISEAHVLKTDVSNSFHRRTWWQKTENNEDGCHKSEVRLSLSPESAAVSIFLEKVCFLLITPPPHLLLSRMTV